MRLFILGADVLREGIELLSAMMADPDGLPLPVNKVAKTLIMFIDMLSDCDDDILQDLIDMFGEAVVIDIVDVLVPKLEAIAKRTGVDIMRAKQIHVEPINNVLAIITE